MNYVDSSGCESNEGIYLWFLDYCELQCLIALFPQSCTLINIIR